MAPRSPTTHPLSALSVLTPLLLALLTPPGALACSPIDPALSDGVDRESVVYKSHISDVVVLGNVTKVMPNHLGPDSYDVDMTVHCVFKGENIEPTIRIEQAGSIPGLCITNDLDLGEDYIVYLSNGHNSTTFTPIAKRDPGSPEYFDEIAVVCGARTDNPKGVDTGKCPSFADYGDYDCFEPPELPPAEPTAEPSLPPMPPTDNMPPPSDTGNTGNAAPPKSPTATPKTAENGASYESVVEQSDENSDNDKDGATSLAWSYTLALCLAAALILL